MYEKWTKCPNFTWYLLENTFSRLIFFVEGGRSKCPLNPRLLCRLCYLSYNHSETSMVQCVVSGWYNAHKKIHYAPAENFNLNWTLDLHHIHAEIHTLCRCAFAKEILLSCVFVGLSLIKISQKVHVVFTKFGTDVQNHQSESSRSKTSHLKSYYHLGVLVSSFKLFHHLFTVRCNHRWLGERNGIKNLMQQSEKILP